MDFTEYAAHHLVDNPHTGGHRPITAIDTLLVYIRRNRTHPLVQDQQQGQQVDGAQRLAQFIRNGTIGRFRAYTANQPSTLQQGKEDRNIPESAIGRIRRTRYAGITVIDLTKHPDSLLG